MPRLVNGINFSLIWFENFIQKYDEETEKWLLQDTHNWPKTTPEAQGRKISTRFLYLLGSIVANGPTFSGSKPKVKETKIEESEIDEPEE